MSVTTVNCTSNTYISRLSQSTDHTGSSSLYTAIVDANGSDRMVHGAILQFSIPSNIIYKKITKVEINYYIGRYIQNRHVAAVIYTPYLIDNVVTAITYDNFQDVGVVGERKGYKVSPPYDLVNYMGADRTDDITEIFTNNLCNGIFSVIINLGWVAGNGEPEVYISGNNSAYLTITYEDVEQLPPTPTYPNDVYIRQGTPVRFSWIYNSLTAATQKGFEIQYKLSTDASYITITQTSPEHSYLYEEELPQGRIDWRVKVVNSIDEISEYSYGSFVVLGKPQMPSGIFAVNKAITTISWNANDQCAYVIDIVKDGVTILNDTVYSQITSYKPNLFLPNGTYTVKIKTKNSIDLWSDEAQKTFTISTTAPTKPTLSIRQQDNKIILDCYYADGLNAVIMRKAEDEAEYKPIVLLNGLTEYEDKRVKNNVEYSYILRVYSDGYNDSDSRSGMIEFEGISLFNKDEEITTSIADTEFIPYQERMNKNKAVINYCGRTYPVIEVGEFEDFTITRRVYMSHSDCEKFKRMYTSGEKLFYRDDRGNAFDCDIASYNINNFMKFGYLVEFEVRKINEEVVIINV